MLRLDQVSRRFGDLAALHELTLDLTAGTRHAVIGPNGAGKTTLINLIAGTLRPTAGTITFDGRDITRLSAPARARRGIGRTWQHPAVFARLTVTANLTLALTRPHRGNLPGQVAQAIDDAGLTGQATVPAGELPYGQQRRLELAMALATRPRLLLLDEPSAGLDPHERAHLTQLLMAHTGDLTVLLVDHNLDLVWTLADTVTVLHHGQHQATDTPDAIRANPHVQAAYLADGNQPARTQRQTQPGPRLLRVQHLRAGYHGAPVLTGIDLDVYEGETVAVLGRNGAGKTTLLNTIAGLHTPAPGSHIDLAGQPLARRRAHQRARAGLAIVPQGRRLFPDLTVAEHLTCATFPGGDRLWTVERVWALLPALAERAHQPARLLSGGEQQMVALARALLAEPRVLLLDEPSEGLAPAVIDQLTTTLTHLAADGLAVLIAEQNLTLATAIADRIIVLDDGQIAVTCPTHQLSEPAHRQRLHVLLGIATPSLPHTDGPASRTYSSEGTACPPSS